jgi:DNA-binding XRE family transcriptional regulator
MAGGVKKYNTERRLRNRAGMSQDDLTAEAA